MLEPKTVTLKEENKTDQTTTSTAVEANDPWKNTEQETTAEKKPSSGNGLWNAFHWGMKFVAIGWVLNAVVSVKLYDKLVNKYPDFVEKFTTKSQSIFDSLGKMAGSEKWSEKTLKKFSTLGKDFTDVIGTSLGGFLMVPLMAMYNHSQEKIQNLFGSKEEKEKFAKEQAEHPKEKESISHWTMARVLGVTSAVTLYMAIKYFAGDKYTKLNEKAVNWARKASWIPKFLRPSDKEVEYYLAEQVAAISSTAVLGVSKKYLDDVFPPVKHAEDHEITAPRIADTIKKRDVSHTNAISDQRKQVEMQTEMEYAR